MLWVVRAEIEDLRKHCFGVNSPISWEPSGKGNHYYDWLGPHECLNDHKTPIHPQNQTQCLLFWVVTLQRGRFCLDPWLHLVHHMCAAWGVQVKCSGSNPESVFSSSPWSVDCCCALANADRFLAPVPMLSEVILGFDSFLIRDTTAAPPPQLGLPTLSFGTCFVYPTSSLGWDPLCSSQFFFFFLAFLLVDS